jgi:hypothetical protein
MDVTPATAENVSLLFSFSSLFGKLGGGSGGRDERWVRWGGIGLRMWERWGCVLDTRYTTVPLKLVPSYGPLGFSLEESADLTSKRGGIVVKEVAHV